MFNQMAHLLGLCLILVGGLLALDFDAIDKATHNNTIVGNVSRDGGGEDASDRMRKSPMPLSARWTEDRNYYGAAPDERLQMKAAVANRSTVLDMERLRRILGEEQQHQQNVDNSDVDDKKRRKRRSGTGAATDERARNRRPDLNKRGTWSHVQYSG